MILVGTETRVAFGGGSTTTINVGAKTSVPTTSSTTNTKTKTTYSTTTAVDTDGSVRNTTSYVDTTTH